VEGARSEAMRKSWHSWVSYVDICSVCCCRFYSPIRPHLYRFNNKQGILHPSPRSQPLHPYPALHVLVDLRELGWGEGGGAEGVEVGVTGCGEGGGREVEERDY